MIYFSIFFTNKKENISIKETDVKEKIIDYVNNNRLFVSIIGVLMMVFCFFLWMTCGAGNSMEAETSYTDVTNIVNLLIQRRVKITYGSVFSVTN